MSHSTVSYLLSIVEALKQGGDNSIVALCSFVWNMILEIVGNKNMFLRFYFSKIFTFHFHLNILGYAKTNFNKFKVVVEKLRLLFWFINDKVMVNFWGQIASFYKNTIFQDVLWCIVLTVLAICQCTCFLRSTVMCVSGAAWPYLAIVHVL